MRLPSNRRYVQLIAVTGLVFVLLLTAAGCGDLGQFPTTIPTPKPEKGPSPTVTSTEDGAILAVYEHLLSLAEGYKAKRYLADFYATCDNWSARSELFKDGTTVWNVVVDMSGTKNWQSRPYWQQASWFILRDGKVIPSNRLQGNALRIEADLQESSQPKS